MSRDPADAGAARGWVEHLRAGGTTPWSEWMSGTAETSGPSAAADYHGNQVISRSPGESDASSGWAGPLPGAAQLELVRRLAVHDRGRVDRGLPPVSSAAFRALADRALLRSGPGRGQPHLPLLLPGPTPDAAVGAPPTDPSDVPVDELIRVGVGLVADLVVEAGPLAAPLAPRRRLWPRPSLHLAGAPVTVDALRASLAAAGVAEGGRKPEVLLVAQPLDEHLAQVWSTRVQHGAPVRWDTFAGRWARRDALPPSADLPRIAAFWADRVGASRVHVLVATPDDVPLAGAASVLGLRSTPGAAAGSDVPPLSAAALDVLRRLNRVLNVRAPEADREALVRRARSLLPARAGQPLALPEERRAWADDRARRVVGAIRTGGYAVHGDLDAIAPRHVGVAWPRRPEVLSLVLETCLQNSLGTAEATRGAGGRTG